jgi:peptide subunit release factor 1 (eRF1)
VYLNVNPARPENRKKAYLIRLKDALKEEGVPREMATRLVEYAEGEQFRARTLVLFAAPDELFETYRLQVELPEGVRWGEPYIAPLELAVDEYKPTGVMLLDAEKFRFFVSSLGEIEEELDARNVFSRAGWREVTVKPSTTTPRGGADRDAFEHRLEARIKRFYRELGKTLWGLVDQFGIRRLILAGPEERTAAFRAVLPQAVRSLVTETVHLPVKASEGEVMKRISAVEARIERGQEKRALAAARERGVRGPEDTLKALQEGRLHQLLAPWPLEGDVRWCDACTLATADGSDESCSYCGGLTRMRALAGLIPELTTARRTRVEFVRGENAEILKEEFGGLAGLVRF